MTDETETKPKAPPKVTAFELDSAKVGDVDTHPFAFGGFPGLWQVGRPMLASALGLTNEKMRELIKTFNLPLVEVKVNESKAYDTFPEDPNRILAGVTPVDPPGKQAPMLKIRDELVPGPSPSGTHPDLQPFAAEQIASDTKNLYPDVDEAAIEEALLESEEVTG